MKTPFLKRKQPGDIPARPPLPRVNVLSDVVVSPAVARPQGLGAAVNGCGGNQQAVVQPPQLLSTPPVLQLTDRDFEAVNPEVMALFEELEKVESKCPKLDLPTPAPPTTGEPEAGPSNLEQNTDSQYSIPFVPPLLSPIPLDDDDFQPSSSKISSGATAKQKNKKNPSKKPSPILRGVLENNNGCSSKDSEDFECFSQSEERDVLKETAKIYKKTKEIISRERSSIDEIDDEIKKLKEKIAKLEEKKKKHSKNLDRASKKLRIIKNIFEK